MVGGKLPTVLSVGRRAGRGDLVFLHLCAKEGVIPSYVDKLGCAENWKCGIVV